MDADYEAFYNLPPCYLDQILSIRIHSSPKFSLEKASGRGQAQFSGGTVLLANSWSDIPQGHPVRKFLTPKDEETIKSSKGHILTKEASGGQVWVVITFPQFQGITSHYGLFDWTEFSYWRKQGGWLIDFLRNRKISIILEGYKLSYQSWLGFLVGIELGSYRFLSHVKGNHDLKGIKIFFLQNTPSFLEALGEAKAWGRGQNIARHLVNIPGNLAFPDQLDLMIRKIFSGDSRIQIESWGQRQLRRHGFNLLLAVGGGSVHSPRFIQIHWDPSKVERKKRRGTLAIRSKVLHWALIGKGVTFDTGGLDIKPSQAMRLMKKDMAGAAAVVGVLYAVSRLSWPIRVSAYLPLAENSVGSRSMRPGDVYRARNGQWIEIHNTDAEGRLILADAMTYALEKTPEADCYIDLATLTGAIKSTLGVEIAGLFSNHDEWATDCLNAGAQVADWAWRIPLYSPYRSALQSTSFADMVNCVDGWGAPITAALFLESFIGQKPWIHIDMYGWVDKPQYPFVESGANGQGVSLLLSFIRSKLQEKHKTSVRTNQERRTKLGRKL